MVYCLEVPATMAPILDTSIPIKHATKLANKNVKKLQFV
jgi:hypothetical protein